MTCTRLTTWFLLPALAVCFAATGPRAQAALIDDFNDVSLAEYTQTTILDNDPPPAITFASPAGGLTASKSAGTGAEQTVFLRSDFSLTTGQILRVDATYPTTQASYGELGIVVSKPPVNLVRDDYVAVYFNPNQNLVKSIQFNGTVNSSAASVAATAAAIRGLFISKTGVNQFQVGYTTGAGDIVQGTYNPTDSSDWTSIGLYADIRAVISVGTLDNLRIDPVPEPSTAVMALGALGLAAVRRRRRAS